MRTNNIFIYAVAAIIISSFFLTSCGKKQDPQPQTKKAAKTPPEVVTPKSTTKTSQDNINVATSLFAQAIEGDIDSTTVTGDVSRFNLSLERMGSIDALFNDTPTQQLTYAYVSNLVAEISPIYLMNRTMREFVGGRDSKGPKQKATMLLFEVIMNREDADPSARMLARYKLGDYHIYHGSGIPERGQPWAIQVLRDAQLSEDASIHEKRTYSSIQLRLMRNLCSNKPEEGIAQIRSIENMVESGLPFPKQPLQIMPLFEAAALIRINRKAEARKLVQELYDKLDTIDDSIIHSELDKGVDAFFEQKGWNEK